MQTPDQLSAGFHFCVTTVHVNQDDFLKSFIRDLSESVQYAKTHPHEKPAGMPKAYGKLAKGVPQSVQDRIGRGYVRIINTLPSVSIPGIWSAPTRESEDRSQSESSTHALSKAKVS